MVGGQIVAGAERIPPHVWGDGSHTIAELIDETNRDPLRGDDHEKPLTKIKTDPVVLAILKKAGRSLDQVPEKGELVPLRESANLSTGGSAKDVTDIIHPSIRTFCERAARVVGLDVCGVDMVLPDITQPYSGSGGFVEVNAAPGIRMHHHPSSGKARDVGNAIVENLYPGDAPSRIPILSITGTNGKTTVTRLIAHVIRTAGRNVGMTTTDGIWIGRNEVARGDMTGPWSARVVLFDPSVEIAVLETARGGIVRSGLGYDWSDISVITNIQADHIGQDGIESVEDIVKIKSLVAERVREKGTLVLNADDENCLGIPARPKVSRVPEQIVWFTHDNMNRAIKDHLRDGGTAYVVSGEWLEERRGSNALRIVRLATVPLTLGGTATFQISNILAAVAACRAYGMEAGQIAAALQSFNSDQNLGRANLYELHGRYVLLDYGHNPAAIAAVGRMANQWGPGRKTCVLGLPGDRTDDLLADSARESARVFDRVILREDDDLRGRKPGELAALLERLIHVEYPGVRCSIIPDETEALGNAVQELREGDIIVAFCERLERSREFLQAQGAKPVSAPVVQPEPRPAPIAAA